MNETTKPLLALGFVMLVLLGLTLINPNFEKTASLSADTAAAVSEIGLRVNMQR